MAQQSTELDTGDAWFKNNEWILHDNCLSLGFVFLYYPLPDGDIFCG